MCGVDWWGREGGLADVELTEIERGNGCAKQAGRVRGWLGNGEKVWGMTCRSMEDCLGKCGGWPREVWRVVEDGQEKCRVTNREM